MSSASVTMNTKNRSNFHFPDKVNNKGDLPEEDLKMTKMNKNQPSNIGD